MGSYGMIMLSNHWNALKWDFIKAIKVQRVPPTQNDFIPSQWSYSRYLIMIHFFSSTSDICLKNTLSTEYTCIYNFSVCTKFLKRHHPIVRCKILWVMSGKIRVGHFHHYYDSHGSIQIFVKLTKVHSWYVPGIKFIENA